MSYRSPVVIKSEDEHYHFEDHKIENEEIHPEQQSPITPPRKTIHTNMGLLATPVRISKMMSNRSESESNDDNDRMGTAIFNENSFTIDHEHQKGM